jgi:hypothetical protein
LKKEVPDDGAEVAPKRVRLTNLTITVFEVYQKLVFLLNGMFNPEHPLKYGTRTSSNLVS